MRSKTDIKLELAKEAANDPKRPKSMNEKKVYKWSGLAALAAISIALYNGWILLPGFYKDSYFRFDTPEGIETIGTERVLTTFIRKGV
jgi:hypothetical protein